MMNWLAYLIVAVAVIRLMVVLSNLIYGPVLQMARTEYRPLISVLIPVRNEEENIGNLLDDLQKQKYAPVEILVFNDQSSDRSADVIEMHLKSQKCIQLMQSEGLPDGWLGKNYACHCLAQKAKGEYLLFLDADVRVGEGLIESSLYQMVRYKLALLSIFPYQIMVSKGERTVVPIMNIVLLSLLPLFLVRRSKYVSLSAANGQFMMFKASVYRHLWPHETMKAKRTEDIAISRYVKRNGFRMDCLMGNTNIQCRMYTGYREALNGFTRSIEAFFGGSFLLALFFWIVTTLGVFVIFFKLEMITLLFYLGMHLIAGWIISVISRYCFTEYMIYLVPRQISFGIILLMTLRNKLLGRNTWKGRNI